MPPHSRLLLLPLILHLSSFQGAAGFQDAAASGLPVPPADCHDASHCAAAASCPLNDPPPPVCKCPPPHWPLVRQLVVVSPLLLRCRCLLSFQHLVAPPPQVPILDLHLNKRLPSRWPLVCQLVVVSPLLSCRPASCPFSTLSCRRQKCPSSTPAFIHTGWLLCLISPRCFRLPSSHQHRLLLMCWLLTSHPIWPQLVACVFDLVCSISWFIAICQGYAPTYLYTTGGGGGCISDMSICRKTRNRVNLGLKRHIFMSKTHMFLFFYVFGNAPIS